MESHKSPVARINTASRTCLRCLIGDQNRMTTPLIISCPLVGCGNLPWPEAAFCLIRSSMSVEDKEASAEFSFPSSPSSVSWLIIYQSARSKVGSCNHTRKSCWKQSSFVAPPNLVSSLVVKIAHEFITTAVTQITSRIGSSSLQMSAQVYSWLLLTRLCLFSPADAESYKSMYIHLYLGQRTKCG